MEKLRRGMLSSQLAIRWIIQLIAVLALGVIGSVEALASAAEGESTSPFFQVNGAEPGIDALPLKSTHVDVTVAGVIAEVRVTQTYNNEGKRPLEARYVFPGSTRAAVHAMTMIVGTRRIEATIKEKEEAKRTYEVAKKAGQTAALLESQRSNVFEMSVANIMPGDAVTVELRYSEILLPTDGEYEWVFPTTVGPRYRRVASAPAEAASVPLASPYYSPLPEDEPVFTLTADIVAGVPLSFLECVSHRVLAASSEGRTRLELAPSEGPTMNRDFVLRYRLGGETIAGGLLLDEWKGEKFFLLTVQPPTRIEPSWIPSRDYVFVVDVSGSMKGFPLTTAKRLLRELLLGLRAQDTFNVILFAGTSRALSESPVSATPEAIAAGVSLLEQQSGGGGTELLPALQRALSLRRAPGVSRSIVVVTDGYIDLEAESYALVRTHLGDANLFAFGIGGSVNRELIERLARAGRAEPAVIEGSTAALKEAARFQSLIASPLLTQVRAEYPGFAAREVQPGALPDVLAQRPLMLVGKWSGEVGGKIRVRGVTGQGAWESEVDVSAGVDLGGCGVLAQLWARERLSELSDLHALGAEPNQRQAEIVALGLKYNLLTRFTSFVAVDTTPRAAGLTADSVRQPNAIPVGMAESENIPTTPEPETVGLVVVAAAIALWRASNRWRKGVRRPQMA